MSRGEIRDKTIKDGDSPVPSCPKDIADSKLRCASVTSEKKPTKEKKARKGSQKRVVKSAALEQLFLQLGEERFQAGDFLYTFLMTYRYFTRSVDVIKALQCVYRQQHSPILPTSTAEDGVFSFDEPFNGVPPPAEPSTADAGPTSPVLPLCFTPTRRTSLAVSPVQENGGCGSPVSSALSEDSHAEESCLSDANQDSSEIFRPRLYQARDKHLNHRRRFSSAQSDSLSELSARTPLDNTDDETEDTFAHSHSKKKKGTPPASIKRGLCLERTASAPLQPTSPGYHRTSSLRQCSPLRHDKSLPMADEKYGLNCSCPSFPASPSGSILLKSEGKSNSIPSNNNKEDSLSFHKTSRWPSLPTMLRKLDLITSPSSPKESTSRSLSGSIHAFRNSKWSSSSSSIDVTPSSPKLVRSRHSVPAIFNGRNGLEGPHSVSEVTAPTDYEILSSGRSGLRSSSVSFKPYNGSPKASDIRLQSTDSIQGSPISTHDVLAREMSQPPGPAPNSVPRHRDQKCSPLTLRVFNILKQWIKTFPDDFAAESQSRELLLDFIDEANHSTFSADIALAKNLRKCLETQCNGNTAPPRKVLHSKSTVGLWGAVKLSSFSYQCLAQQLTLRTHEAFCRIQPGELCKQAWKRSNRKEIAPNVCATIDRCNRLGNWVPTEILAGKTPAKRAEAIEKIIRVAYHCLELHNLNDTLIIAYSLQNSAVERLSKSWKLVPSKALKLLEDIKKKCSPNERYQAMRTYIHACEPPCVPFIGAYLDMIYGIDVTLNTFDDEGFVNFSKMARLAKQIRELIQFQQERYTTLEVDLAAQQYLDTIIVMDDDDEIFSLSLEREPRDLQRQDSVACNDSTTSFF